MPIDLGHDVDAALAATRLLAAPYQAAVALLSGPEPGSPATRRPLPSASALASELDREDLHRRLGDLADKLRAELPDVRTLVLEQKPADAILETATSLPADVIVLVTDAHGGFAAWYAPSIAQRLLARPDLTLLLIKEL